jgi:hypothetical protein
VGKVVYPRAKAREVLRFYREETQLFYKMARQAIDLAESRKEK